MGGDSVGSGLGPVVGFCEHGDECSCSGTTGLVTYIKNQVIKRKPELVLCYCVMFRDLTTAKVFL
jgi:hypothetical protein